ncbi:MAG: tetratricopeptide repeat protein [Gammaproteobacteria bacterium]
MSLVNQVLKDLQHRRSEHPDTSGLFAADTASRPRARTWWLPLGAGAIIVGLAAFAAQQFLARDAAIEPPVEVVATNPGATPLPREPEATITADPEIAITAEPKVADVGAVPSQATDPEPVDVGAAPLRREPVVTTVTEPAPSLTRTLVTTTPRQRADTAFGAGVRALSEGRRDTAESAFRDALGHDASHTDARLALANVLAANGALREAEVQLQQGLRIAPDAAALAERYARLLFERGDLAGAIGVLVNSAPPVSSNPDYHALLAALQQRAGNHAAAASTYAALVDARPTQGLWWMGLGISLEAEQRNDAAYSAYENALRDARLSAEVVAFVRERVAVLAR